MFCCTLLSNEMGMLTFQPIQLREDVPDRKCRIEKLGVYHSDTGFLNQIMKSATSFEKGLFVARDIGKNCIFYTE